MAGHKLPIRTRILAREVESGTGAHEDAAPVEEPATAAVGGEQ